MKFESEELNKNQYWILGTKLKSENIFTLQIIDGYKRYSSLYTKCLNDKSIDFYILEMELPDRLKKETCPF